MCWKKIIMILHAFNLKLFLL